MPDNSASAPRPTAAASSCASTERDNGQGPDAVCKKAFVIDVPGQPPEPGQKREIVDLLHVNDKTRRLRSRQPVQVPIPDGRGRAAFVRGTNSPSSTTPISGRPAATRTCLTTATSSSSRCLQSGVDPVVALPSHWGLGRGPREMGRGCAMGVRWAGAIALSIAVCAACPAAGARGADPGEQIAGVAEDQTLALARGAQSSTRGSPSTLRTKKRRRRMSRHPRAPARRGPRAAAAEGSAPTSATSPCSAAPSAPRVPSVGDPRDRDLGRRRAGRPRRPGDDDAHPRRDAPRTAPRTPRRSSQRRWWVRANTSRAHGGDTALARPKIAGTGVKVCVLSDGVDSLGASQAAGELPARGHAAR